MSQRFGLLFTVLIGGLVVRISATDEYLSYVRPGMRPWLLISAAVLLVVGVVGIGVSLSSRFSKEESSWRRAFESGGDDSHELHAHGSVDHGHGAPKAAWLLVLPVVALLVFPSKPLGSFAAAHRSGISAKGSPMSSAQVPADIPPPVAGAQPMEILDFLDKTYYDPAKTLAGKPVTIIGFVAPSDRSTDDFLLTRFMIACCAADARPVQVAVTGYNGYTPEVDTWVEVTGSWIPEPEGSKPRLGTDGFPLPHLLAVRVAPVDPPENPYAFFSGF